MANTQPDLDEQPLLKLDALARRRLVAVCVVYLLVGLLYAGHFMLGDLADLRLARGEATAELEVLEQQEPAATDQDLHAARSDLDERSVGRDAHSLQSAAEVLQQVAVGAVREGELIGCEGEPEGQAEGAV